MYLGNLILVTFLFYNDSLCSDLFEEELVIKELGNGHTALHFNFVIKQPNYDPKNQHFHLFPKSIHNIVSKYNVDEFHLSMVQGFWDSSSWGSSFTNNANGGAEVWAWFSKHAYNVDFLWSYFLEALSGQFCASLSQLGLSKNHISPKWSHMPSGLFENQTKKNINVNFRYAQLPHEELCTENLTPWTKLLPCKKLMGLASLIKPGSTFKAHYNSLNIDIRRICMSTDCMNLGIELRQSLTIVYDRRYLYNNIKEPWMLTALLGETFKKSCPVASRSQIIIMKPIQNFSLSVPPNLNSTWDSRLVLAVYESSEVANSLIFTPIETISAAQMGPINMVTIMKYVTGKGDIRGGVNVVITNHIDTPIKLVLLDSAPWFTEVYFSSIKAKLQSTLDSNYSDYQLNKIRFHPSVPRQRMAFFEIFLNIPSMSRIKISYKFKKILMHWNEYLPDANHGVYLPTATVAFQLSSYQLHRLKTHRSPLYWEMALPMWASSYADMLSVNQSFFSQRVGDGFVRVHSETSLVRLPVPDFSMPFNALCLVCSIVAVLFGIVHKMTTKLMVPVAGEDALLVGKPPIYKMIRWIIASLKFLFRTLISKLHHEKTE